MSADLSWVDRVRAVVESTCADQGIPVCVTDRGALRQVVVLLSADRP